MALAKAMDLPVRALMKAQAKHKAKAHLARRPLPPPSPPKPGANEPCPCGSVDEKGKPYKFKRCCGSASGNLVYFVINGQDALTNEEGRVLIFKEQGLAIQTAKVKRWYNGEVIPMAPHRFARFKAEVPYVMVSTKEFDVGTEENPSPVPQAHQALTTVQGILSASGVVTHLVKEPGEEPVLLVEKP
jgi:hypothetical protein